MNCKSLDVDKLVVDVKLLMQFFFAEIFVLGKFAITVKYIRCRYFKIKYVIYILNIFLSIKIIYINYFYMK